MIVFTADRRNGAHPRPRAYPDPAAQRARPVAEQSCVYLMITSEARPKATYATISRVTRGERV